MQRLNWCAVDELWFSCDTSTAAVGRCVCCQGILRTVNSVCIYDITLYLVYVIIDQFSTSFRVCRSIDSSCLERSEAQIVQGRNVKQESKEKS